MESRLRELKICTMIPCVFLPMDMSRPMNDAAPTSPVADNKRKYDWAVHEDTPIRPTLVSRPWKE